MIKKILYSVLGVIVLVTLVIIIGYNSSQPVPQTQNNAPTENRVINATSSVESASLGNDEEKLSSLQSNKPISVIKKVDSVSLYPNPTLTPGDVLSVDTSKICVSGYTSTVRDVPLSLKKQVYAEYGVSYPQATGAYEVDHFIPLEIGGSNDIKNLWLEPASPIPGFHQKDQYENYSHSQVCSGVITIQEAQRRMTTDWYKYWIEETGGISISNTSIQATSTVVTPTTSTSSNTSEPQVKKSTTGICHEIGSTYYDRTTDFTPYNSMNDCLASGGRLPKQ